MTGHTNDYYIIKREVIDNMIEQRLQGQVAFFSSYQTGIRCNFVHHFFQNSLKLCNPLSCLLLFASFSSSANCEDSLSEALLAWLKSHRSFVPIYFKTHDFFFPLFWPSTFVTNWMDRFLGVIYQNKLTARTYQSQLFWALLTMVNIE
jgi:hypothetical protein